MNCGSPSIGWTGISFPQIPNPIGLWIGIFAVACGLYVSRYLSSDLGKGVRLGDGEDVDVGMVVGGCGVGVCVEGSEVASGEGTADTVGISLVAVEPQAANNVKRSRSVRLLINANPEVLIFPACSLTKTNFNYYNDFRTPEIKKGRLSTSLP